MRRVFAASLVTALFATAACDGSTKPPGFQQIGGAGSTSTTEAASSVSVTHAASVTVSVGTTGSASSGNAVSSSSGDNCLDNGAEPNQTEQEAWNLGNISDDDNDQDSISGVADGAFDPDWYRFHGADTTFKVVDPTRSLVASAPVRLCKFFDCDNGEQASFTCPSGTTSASSPDGRPGCCSMGGFTISDFQCGGSTLNSDDAIVYIRIDNPDNNPCPSYTLTYHY
ncbi:MAG: hypothetical protein U0414_26155 [Polyangiaceae bacterium]